MPPFNFERVRINWFPSHMRRALDKMERILHRVDMIVEVRDARIPVSSSNDRFEEIFKKCQRILVFNKRDLAEDESNNKLYKLAQGLPYLITNGLNECTTVRILEILQGSLKTDDRVLIVGIPNVGKSTLINGMRHKGVERTKGNATPVGRLAGVTKNVTEVIRILDEPKIYSYDSPGIMLPSGSDIAALIKIAATGGINDNAVLKEDLVHYVYHLMNERNSRNLLDFYELEQLPPGGVVGFIELLCKKFNAVTPNRRLNTDVICVKILRDFRMGKFGKITLDEF